MLSGGTEHRSCCTGLETMTREWTCGLWAASWGRWSTTVLCSPGRMTLISWGWWSDTWAPPLNMSGLECLSSLTTARWAHPHTWSHCLFWLFQITFPDCLPVSYEDMIPEATSSAVDLLQQFIIYNSDKRMSAGDALKHEYFFEKPFPVPRDAMTRPREKRFESGASETLVDIPFHQHFDKLLNIIEWRHDIQFCHWHQLRLFDIMLIRYFSNVMFLDSNWMIHDFIQQDSLVTHDISSSNWVWNHEQQNCYQAVLLSYDT